MKTLSILSGRADSCSTSDCVFKVPFRYKTGYQSRCGNAP